MKAIRQFVLRVLVVCTGFCLTVLDVAWSQNRRNSDGVSSTPDVAKDPYHNTARRRLSVTQRTLSEIFVGGQLLYSHDGNKKLFTVDLFTGSITVIGRMSKVMWDIAFDEHGNLYGVDSHSSLYQIHPGTAATNYIGDLGVSGVNALVFSPQGTLFAAGHALYVVDVTSGAAITIGDLSGYRSAGDLIFDADGILYISTISNDLVRVDPTTGTASLIGPVGFDTVFGLVITPSGVAYGVSSTTEELFSLDLGTGIGSLVSDFSRQDVRGAYGASLLLAPIVLPVLIAPLEITDQDEYHTRDAITSQFTLRNLGTAAITFDVVTVGGRYGPPGSPFDFFLPLLPPPFGDTGGQSSTDEGKLPDGKYPDFTWQRNITLNSGDTYQYQGELLLTEAGNYHFFCAYRDQEGNWNSSIDLGYELTDRDRVRDIEVLLRPYIASIDPQEGAPGIEVTIEGLNLTTRDGFGVLTFGVVNFGDETVIGRPNEDNDVIVKVPSPREVGEQTIDVVVESDSGQSNPAQFTYKGPLIERIEPPIGRAAEEVTIKGKNFGEKDIGFGFELWFGKSRVQIIKSWQDAEIVVNTPGDYGSGENEQRIKKLLAKISACGVAIELGCGSVCVEVCKDVVVEHIIQELVELGIILFTKEGLVDMPVDVKVRTPVGESNTEMFTYQMPPIIQAILESPGELRIYDSGDNVTGLVGGEVKEEIPNSIYNEDEKNVIIISPLDTYSYEVFGTEDGTYELTVISVRDNVVGAFIAEAIPTSVGETHVYTVADWGALAEDKESVIVQIDRDSDGVFERSFISGSRITREEFDSEEGLPPYQVSPLCGVGLCGSGLATMLPLIFVWMVRRKMYI